MASSSVHLAEFFCARAGKENARLTNWTLSNRFILVNSGEDLAETQCFYSKCTDKSRVQSALLVSPLPQPLTSAFLRWLAAGLSHPRILRSSTRPLLFPAKET